MTLQQRHIARELLKSPETVFQVPDDENTVEGIAGLHNLGIITVTLQGYKLRSAEKATRWLNSFTVIALIVATCFITPAYAKGSHGHNSGGFYIQHSSSSGYHGGEKGGLRNSKRNASPTRGYKYKTAIASKAHKQYMQWLKNYPQPQKLF